MRVLLTFWQLVEPKDSNLVLIDSVNAVFVKWGDDDGTQLGLRSKSGGK